MACVTRSGITAVSDNTGSQTTRRGWTQVVRMVGGVWTLGRLDVVIHDQGLMVMWAAKLHDKGVPRDWVIWRMS